MSDIPTMRCVTYVTIYGVVRDLDEVLTEMTNDIEELKGYKDCFDILSDGPDGLKDLEDRVSKLEQRLDNLIPAFKQSIDSLVDTLGGLMQEVKD